MRLPGASRPMQPLMTNRNALGCQIISSVSGGWTCSGACPSTCTKHKAQSTNTKADSLGSYDRRSRCRIESIRMFARRIKGPHF